MVTITGSGFSPVVIDALTSAASVQMPRVFLGVDGGEFEVPPAGVTTGNAEGTVLTAVIPQGLVGPSDATGPAVVYDVRVENPNGNDGTLSGALTVVPPPSVTAVDPVTGAQGTTVQITLTGTGFRDGMTITLDATPAVVGTNVVVTSPTSATADLDLTGVAAGTYDITVTNPEGCSATLPAAFTVFVPKPLTIIGIEPPFGCTCDTTTVTIFSDAAFVSTPQVEMRPNGASSPIIRFERVAFIDANTLTAQVPAGAPVGSYDVTVINPPSDGGIGTLVNGFRVVANPIPTIEMVVPSRGEPGATVPVQIFGENFRDPVSIELIDATNTAVFTLASVTPTSAGLIDATFDLTGIAEAAYLVRVTNLDEATYSTFSNFLVAALGSSGNLHAFNAEPTLNEGRRLLAATRGRDPAGNRYLYAIGGDTGAMGTVLDTVEVTQLSAFGALGTWRTVRNSLTSARVGASAVSVPVFDPMASPFVPIKNYLYVVGGRDETGAVLNTVERALVLSGDDTPKVTAQASPTAGTLAAGTWYYKVSAVLSAADPDNPGGETLPSDEAIITIGGTNASVTLSWDPVTVNGIAAASYRIYRTAAVDGASQTELLLADNVTGTSFEDTGEAVGTEAPLPPGATGVWVVSTQTLATARWGHGAVLATDTAEARFLYAVGGKSDNASAYLGSVEYAPISVDGTLGAFTTSATAALNTARAFFSLVIESADEVAGFTLGTRFFVVGGSAAAGGGAPVSNTTSMEYADITTGGGNGAWTNYSGAGSKPTVAGPMAIIRSEKLFMIGGANASTNTTFGNVLAGGIDLPFDLAGNLDPPSQSTPSLLAPRALGVAVLGSGFIYFIGGTGNGTNALATVESTF